MVMELSQFNTDACVGGQRVNKKSIVRESKLEHIKVLHRNVILLEDTEQNHDFFTPSQPAITQN